MGKQIMTPAQIREARQSLGLTPPEAARLLGYADRARISEIEHGRRQPSAAVLLLLKAYLDGYRPADWPKNE